MRSTQFQLPPPRDPDSKPDRDRNTFNNKRSEDKRHEQQYGNQRDRGGKDEDKGQRRDRERDRKTQPYSGVRAHLAANNKQKQNAEVKNRTQDSSEPEEFSATEDYSEDEDARGYFTVPKAVATPRAQPRPHFCEICDTEFPSSNALFDHLKRKHRWELERSSANRSEDFAIFYTSVDVDKLQIIKSMSDPAAEPGYGFRSWRYMTTDLFFNLQSESQTGVMDTGCGPSSIDMTF